jgi:outer membrane protein assembly factor BamB
MRVWIAAGLLVLAGCSRTRGADPSFGPNGEPPIPAVCVTRCDDGLYCNGPESCDPATLECFAGEPVDCDDDDECTVDRCDDDARSCQRERTPRDEDRDGHDACDDDCDDQASDVHPGATETCDARDEDCDGETDEQLLSECGDCRPGCRLLHLPEPGTMWMPTEENSDAVVVDGPSGPLELSSTTRQRFDAWIANFVEGAVTKLDTRTGVQLARYDSVLEGDDNGAEPVDVECDHDGKREGGNCPARTAVDFSGAVYVANRAFGNQGTVTKIAGFEDDCVDRDGDGEIDTSSDVNGNGQIDRFAPGEYLGQRDECLLWTRNVGGNNSVPRALAVAANGNVWVGLYGESRVLELDPSTGDTLRSVPVPGFKPYGAAIDGRGGLWITQSLTGQILRIDVAKGTAGQALTAPGPQSGCPSSYGIAVDASDRVWVAGFTCPFAFRYDQDVDAWFSVPLPDSGVTRGIAADDQGLIYTASSHDWLRINLESSFGFLEASDPITRLSVFTDEGEMKRVLDLRGRGAIGVGLDSERRAWLVNQDTGTATRVDLSTDEPEVKQFAAGELPYTYSDFTGFALRRITAATGFIRGTLEGCALGPSEWEELRVDADVAGTAQVLIRLRTAETRDGLDDTQWLGPFDTSTVDLRALMPELSQGGFIEIEARLVSPDRRSSPSLHEITVQLHCPLG